VIGAQAGGAKSFADAKGAKYLIENIFHANRAGQAGEGGGGIVQILGAEF
jgi:hypothetical protein